MVSPYSKIFRPFRATSIANMIEITGLKGRNLLTQGEALRKKKACSSDYLLKLIPYSKSSALFFGLLSSSHLKSFNSF